jgi:DNA-binding MarR family transcriptional regulator
LFGHVPKRPKAFSPTIARNQLKSARIVPFGLSSGGVIAIRLGVVVTGKPHAASGLAFDELEHELAVVMRRARGLSGALARDVHPDVDASAYGLLARIDEVGSVRVTDLASYFSVGKPTVSRQVALLEQLNLVQRTQNEEDARSRHLSLTDAGRALLERAREARRERTRATLEAWTAEDVAQFATLLRRFNETF